MTHHYDYRLPPDTFLARRDSNWYIGDAASDLDIGKREVVGAHASVALADMSKKIDSILRASFSDSKMVGGAFAASVPGIGLLVLPAFKNAVEARKFLTDARDKLVKPGGAAGQKGSTTELMFEVVRDRSIPYDEVVRRVKDFLSSTAQNIDEQIKLNQKSANIFSNALAAFEKAAGEVANSLIPKDKDIPVWVWAVGGLAGLATVAYIVGKVTK
jgi:hypothetical protein